MAVYQAIIGIGVVAAGILPGKVSYPHANPRVRTRSLAGVRNLTIGVLRLAGRTDLTEATRWAGRSADRPFTILGLTS